MTYPIEAIADITGLTVKYLKKAFGANTVGLYDAEAVERKIRNTQIKGATLEGRREEKLGIAKKLKDDGVSIKKIMEYTSLTEEDIDSL